MTDKQLPAVRSLPTKKPDELGPGIKGFKARVMIEWPPDSGNWGIVGEGVVQEAGWEEDVQPIPMNGMYLEYEPTGYRTIRLTVYRGR